MARKRKLQKQTLLLVGEGETEKAFLQHLYTLYSTGALKIKIKSAGGKGPKNVINDAIGTLKNTDYDTTAVLLDTDLAWPPALVKAATSQRIKLLGANPCLEGLLLSILKHKKPTPCNNQTCKKTLHPLLSGKATDKASYTLLFNKDLLDKAVDYCHELKILVALIKGEF